MESDMDSFLSEGMKNYKKASIVMRSFFKSTQDKLQHILDKRKEWGTFLPRKIKAIRSTKYSDDYPYINAQIHGTIDEKPAIIEIAVDWYESKSYYPFYCVYVYEPRGMFDEKILECSQEGRVRSYRRNSGHAFLILDPDPEDFNLERDFDLLLDEFVKIVFNPP